MENIPNVKYKAAAQNDDPEASGHSINIMEGNNEPDTDTNIFALGDAAANMGDLDEDLDDLFSGFGMKLNDILHGGGQGKITTKHVKVPVPANVPEKASPGEAAPGPGGTVPRGTLQVSTISQKLDDGRSLHTRVIKGPVQCKKRVVRISREGPNGLELLTELEAPPGSDMNSLLAAAIPQSLGISQGSVYADYDNLNPAFKKAYASSEGGSEYSESSFFGSDGTREGTPLQEVKSLDTESEDIQAESVSDVPPSKPFVRFKEPDREERPGRTANNFLTTDEESRTKLLGDPTVEHADMPMQNNVGNDVSPNAKPFSKFSKSFKRGAGAKSFRQTMKRNSLAPLPDEDAIQLYEPPENLEDASDTESGRQCCVCIKKGRKKKSTTKSFMESGKKSGMTALHLDKEGVLPGIKALVANYAKMLYEDRDQFIETMYRAVKLNNLDVTRILCKIVQKSGHKLSGFDLREPESSATILHVAMLYNHGSIVRMLLSLHDRELILAKYETVEYKNQTCLHLAVANENPELIESILLALEPHDRVVLINTIADGKYFRRKHPDGQLCVTAAAWAENIEVIKSLVKYGGQLGLKNSQGNTLLHSIIIQSTHFPEKDHYHKLLDCVWESCGLQATQLTLLYDTKYEKQKELKQKELQENLFRDLLQVRNDDGYTPLALAVALGSKLVKVIVNMEKIFKIPQNKLGSIAWVTYDVTDITSFHNDKYNKFSVLHILAHNSKQLSDTNDGTGEAEDFLDMEPMGSIITAKWKKVYRWVYIFWFVVHLVYMMVFTACTASTNSKPLGDEVVEPQLWLIIFMVLPSIYLFLECIDLGGIKPYRIQYLTNQNYFKRIVKCFQSEWTVTGNGPYRLVNFGFSSFILQWYILYLGKDEMQDIALAMALLLGWIFLLNFTRACRVTCRFSIMLQKMFFRDLIYFLAVYGIVLLAFSFAISSLFIYKAKGNPELTINKVFYDMMNVVTDLDQKQSVEEARHATFAKLMLILYAIIAVILLMNMLIAMMNTSYETVRVTRFNLWRQQQLSIMLMMERRFFWLKSLCRRSENEVWRKEISDNVIHSFMDVTMLHQPGQKVT